MTERKGQAENGALGGMGAAMAMRPPRATMGITMATGAVVTEEKGAAAPRPAKALA